MSQAVTGHKAKSFRPDIEGLRGIAVLLVVLYHAHFPYVNGGYIGVDVFFVISGYLISGLLMKEMETTGRISFLQFYARRGRRLLPAAALTVLVTLGAGFFTLAPVEQNSLAKTAITTSLYCSNFRFIHEKTDYLAADSNADPLLHTWSLAVEEQFYLFWPLLILLGMRAFAGGRQRRSLFWLMSIVGGLSFAASVFLTRYNQPWAFFSSPTRAWEFAVGAIACLWNSRSSQARIMKLLPWAGLLLIFGTSFFYATETPFPGVAAVLPVLGAAFLLPSGARQSTSRVLLENPVSQFLGSISYSWYLWHWPVLVLAGLVWKMNLPGRMVCVLVSIGLAWLTQILVENPVRFHPALVPKPGFSMALTGGLTLLSVAVCASFYVGAAHLEKTNGQMQYTRALKDLPIIDRDGCNVGYGATHSPACVFGDTASSTEVVLFGDSHAGQWFPAFDRIAKDNHWKLISLTKAACPAPTLTYLYDRNVGRNYDACATWRSNTIQQIVALHPAAVITSSYSSHYLTQGGVTPAEWEAGLHTTLVQLERAGSRILILHDPPSPSFDVPVCMARAAWTNSGNSCSFEPNLVLNTTIVRLEKEATENLLDTEVVDVSSLICAGEECGPSRNGMMLYRDEHHLTASYVLGLAPFLEPKMAGLMGHLN
jgi:peptidoglycan/LPS O-acetylase OafA/YrhL